MARISDEQKKQIRESILNVGKEHFLSKGFTATKTKDIAKEVGVAEGTIFNYFPTKTDIFLQTMAEGYMTNAMVTQTINYQNTITEIIFELFYKTLKPIVKLPKKIINDIAIAALRLTKANSSTMKRIAQLDYNLLDDLEGILKKLVAEKRLKPCDTSMVANILFCVVTGEIIFYVYEDKITKKKMFVNAKEKISFTLQGHIL